MLINKDGKLFGKINIIDVAALVVVIVFCAGIAVRLGHTGKIVAETDGKCAFTVRVDNLRAEGADAVIAGDEISDGVDSVYGKIVSVRKEQYADEIIKTDGTKVKAEHPGRYTVYADVELEGRWKDGIFYFDKESVGQGGNFWIITKNVKCLGKVDSNVKKIN